MKRNITGERRPDDLSKKPLVISGRGLDRRQAMKAPGSLGEGSGAVNTHKGAHPPAQGSQESLCVSVMPRYLKRGPTRDARPTSSGVRAPFGNEPAAHQSASPPDLQPRRGE